MKRSTGLQATDQAEKLAIGITCIHTLSCDIPDLNFIYTICPDKKQMAIANPHGIQIFGYFDQQTYTHERKEGSKVVQIVSNKTGTLWACSHDDCTVKVYDQGGNLVREVQFNESISCVSFANTRGDLIVGVSDQLSLVRIQDYLTTNILRKMAFEEYTDDELEDPINFEEEDSAALDSKAETKTQPTNIPDDAKIEQLLALSAVRKEEAKLRRNKRRFLETERATYNTEVELKKKKDELMKRIEDSKRAREERIQTIKDTKRQEEEHLKLLGIDTTDPQVRQDAHLDEIPPENLEEEELIVDIEFANAMMLMEQLSDQNYEPTADEAEEDELYFKPTMGSLPRLSLKPDTFLQAEADHYQLELTEREKMQKLLMTKFDERTKLKKQPTKAHFENVEPMVEQDDGPEEVGGKKKSRSKRKRALTKKKSKMIGGAVPKRKESKHHAVFLDSDDDQKDIKTDSLELSSNLGIITVQIDEDERSQEKDEIHQKLVGVSSEQYQKDLKDLKNIQEKKDKEKPKEKADEDKPKYTPGIELPNSVALPEILPMFLGKQILNKGEQLFQKYDIRQMYRRASRAHLDSDENPTPQRKLFKKSTFRADLDLEDDPDFVMEEQRDESIVQETTPKPVEQSQPAPQSTGSSNKVLPQPIKEVSDEEDTPDLLKQYMKEAKDYEEKTKKKGKKAKNSKHTKSKSSLDLLESPKSIEVLPANEEEMIDATDKIAPIEKRDIPMEPLGDKVTKKILKTHGLDRRTSIKPVKFVDVTRRKSVIPEALKPNDSRLTPLKEREREDIKRPAVSPIPPHTPKIHFVKFKEANQEKSLKAEKSFKKEYKFENVNLAQPILKVLGETAPKIEGPLTIEKISHALNTVLQNPNPIKVKEAAGAIVNLFKMFENDLTLENKFDMFIAPLIDKFENDNPVVRNTILQSIVQIGFQHDNVLVLLVTALSDRNSEVKNTAVKGLGQFGIADKEALKRAMMELGMIKGRPYRYSNALIDVCEYSCSKLQLKKT
jgi:hypothetical protein